MSNPFPRDKAPIYDLIYSELDQCYYCVPRDEKGNADPRLNLLAANRVPASGLYAITGIPIPAVLELLEKYADKYGRPLAGDQSKLQPSAMDMYAKHVNNPPKIIHYVEQWNGAYGDPDLWCTTGCGFGNYSLDIEKVTCEACLEAAVFFGEKIENQLIKIKSERDVNTT